MMANLVEIPCWPWWWEWDILHILERLEVRSRTGPSDKMGPFNNPPLTNLYATETHRKLVDLKFLPAMPPGTCIGWTKEGLRVAAPAGSLVGGSEGAVTLGVSSGARLGPPRVISRHETVAGRLRWLAGAENSKS